MSPLNEWPATTSLSTHAEAAVDTVTPRMQIQCDTALPSLGPHSPTSDSRDQRRQRDQKVYLLSGHRFDLVLERRQILDVDRADVRKTSTRMASPIADSAAATVRMKKTKTCPEGR